MIFSRLLVIVLDKWSRGTRREGETHGMTNLLSALRSERKRIQQAIRNLGQDKHNLGAQTHRTRHPLLGALVRLSTGPTQAIAESVTGLRRERALTDAMQGIKVIPIRRDILASDEDWEVADLAYDIWLSNGFRGGSPEEALMTAVRQSRTKTTAGLSLVPKRKSAPDPFPALRLHSS